MKHIAIILALIIGTPSIADAQFSKADRAIQCSAIYLIATALTTGNKQASNAFMGLQRTFDGVYSINEGQRLKRTITNGMVSKKKSQMQMKLAKMYDSNPQSVYALEMQCNAWREKLSRHLITRIGKSSNRM